MSGSSADLGSGCATLALTAVLLASCGGPSGEQRIRAAAEKIQESIPDADARALAQKLDPAVVQETQQRLAALDEYQGEINGVLDAVTVNAIQAFQRSAGLPDDGILDGRTRDRLVGGARH